MIIPLESVPFQRFKVNLGRIVTVIIKYSTRFGYFSVDVYEDDDPVTLGRGLHPEMDIFQGLDNGLGRLFLTGKAPTVENLGVENQLNHEIV